MSSQSLLALSADSVAAVVCSVVARGWLVRTVCYAQREAAGPKTPRSFELDCYNKMSLRTES